MDSNALLKDDGLNEPESLTDELTEWDIDTFKNLVSLELTEEQKQRVLTPPRTDPSRQSVMAVHWHPEHASMDLIKRRVDTMFPNRESELIIPTQHNIIMENDGYCGVEVDCESSAFNAKVQLLLHFKASKLEKADVLRSMLAHTLKYRSSQLLDFIDTLINPDKDDRLQTAADETGANDDVVRFAGTAAKKLNDMLVKFESIVPSDSLKNKLIANYIDAMRLKVSDKFVNRVQLFIKAVKKIVKKEFPLRYFYRASEIIEEVRGLGGGVVIPHPEQFWPILLANYDVDGYEVWNPQSRRYTEFLINVVKEQNKSNRHSSRPLLIFMGDDTHFGEKIKEPKFQNSDKAGREVGYQPAWEELAIQKSLMWGNFTKASVIAEYKNRLS